MDPSKPGNRSVIFRTNSTITAYNGHTITKAKNERRYLDKTSPYGVQLRNENEVSDGACHRGVGTLINHAPESRANAKFSFSRNGVLQIKATKDIRNHSQIFINYNIGDGLRYRFNEPGVRHETR